jgi:hypothetical protein
MRSTWAFVSSVERLGWKKFVHRSPVPHVKIVVDDQDFGCDKLGPLRSLRRLVRAARADPPFDQGHIHLARGGPTRRHPAYERVRRGVRQIGPERGEAPEGPDEIRGLRVADDYEFQTEHAKGDELVATDPSPEGTVIRGGPAPRMRSSAS